MKKLLGGVALAGVAVPSFAAGVDVTAVTTAITNNTASLVLIGAAVLTLVYTVRVFSWGRKI